MRQDQHEGFRLARMASSYLSRETRDSDQAAYVNIRDIPVRVDLRNENGFIFSAPLPLGRPKLFLSHSDAQPRNTPTLSIKFSEPSPNEITPQGFVTSSLHSNDDNADLWGNWDRAKSQYAAGEMIRRFAYTLEATPPGLCRAASVSAASYNGAMLAPESIATVFGANLAITIQSATLPIPTSLAGTEIKFKDSFGIERLAPLFFVSPTQANCQIPPGTATGAATVTVTSEDGDVCTGVTQITTTAPGLFAANANGQGVAAAIAVRVRADNSQQFELVAQHNGTQWVSRPIDLGPETDLIVLVMFGTGIRYRTSPGAVTAKIGGVDAQVDYAGPQNDFVGLDQINVRVPRSLAGRGEVDVVLTVDGKTANAVRINIR